MDIDAIFLSRFLIFHVNNFRCLRNLRGSILLYYKKTLLHSSINCEYNNIDCIKYACLQKLTEGARKNYISMDLVKLFHNSELFRKDKIEKFLKEI